MQDENVYDKLDDHEKRISAIETQVEVIDGRVDSLEKWMPILIQDNKDTLRFMNEQINRIDTKIDKTLDRNESMVKDAASRVPKWVMWLFGIFITAVMSGIGWLVEVMSYHH